jgi:hypothetical protein
MDERSTKQQPIITMETLPDDLDDESHQAMDEAILDTIGGDPYSPKLLLPVIVEHSRRRLNEEYAYVSKAGALLEANPKLKDLLDAAWESKSFRAVRNLSLSTSSENREFTEQKCRNLAFVQQYGEGTRSTPLRER